MSGGLQEAEEEEEEDDAEDDEDDEDEDDLLTSSFSGPFSLGADSSGNSGEGAIGRLADSECAGRPPLSLKLSPLKTPLPLTTRSCLTFLLLGSLLLWSPLLLSLLLLKSPPCTEIC